LEIYTKILIINDLKWRGGRNGAAASGVVIPRAAVYLKRRPDAAPETTIFARKEVSE
jgi:hypothetical protein